MKKLIIVLLCLFIGWLLGYLQFPYLQLESDFWVGFAIAACIALFVQLSWSSEKKKKTAAVFALAILLVISGWLVSQFMHQKNVNAFTSEKKSFFLDQAKLIESMQKEAYASQLGNVLNAIDLELNSAEHDTLSQSLISRISKLCYGLKPYQNYSGDSLYDQALSPERGQLLLALLNLPIDSSSLLKIKQSADFSSCDLSGANLEGQDLSHLNLSRANLEGANLQGTHWEGVNLSYANLWGAKINRSHFLRSQLKGANLNWSILTHSKFDSCQMRGTKFNDATLENAVIHQSYLRWAEMKRSNLEHSRISHSDFKLSKLSEARFKEALLDEVYLVKSEINGVDFTRTNFNQLAIEEDWYSILEKSKCLGSDAIKSDYSIVSGTSKIHQEAKFFLIKN